MIRHLPVVAILLVLLAAGCSGGKDSSPEIVVTATQSAVDAGGDPVTLTATLDGAPVDVVWALTGPGTIQYVTGDMTRFAPPRDVPEPIAVTVVALTEEGRGEADITVGVRGFGTVDLTIEGVGFDPGYDFAHFVDEDGNDFGFRDSGSHALRADTYFTYGDFIDLTSSIADGFLDAGGVFDTVEIRKNETTAYRIEFVGAAGFVWATSANAVHGYLGQQIETLGAVPPVRSFATGATLGSSTWDPVFQTLWVANLTSNAILSFDARALSIGSNLAPTTTLLPALVGGTASIAAPSGVDFDSAQGVLWVGNAGNGTIAGFTNGQNPPSFFIGADLTHPSIDGIAVDDAGNVWAIASGNVMRFDAATLGTTSLPNLILTGGAPQGTAIAIDANGNVWVADTDRVLRYDAGNVAGSGVQVASPDLTLTSAAIVLANGLTFDLLGQLWVSDAMNGVFYFSTPTTTASGMVNGDAGFATNTPHDSVAIGRL